MAQEVDTSFYKPANPLDQYQQMMGLQTMGLHQHLMKIQQNSLLLDNAKSKLDMIRNVLGAHANDPNVSRESIVKSAGDLIAMSHGAISPQEVANYTATMPEGGDALKSWLQQKNTEMLSAEQRLGQAIQMNDGAKQHLLRLMPNNQVTELGTLSNKLSPGEKATPQPTVGYDAKGKPVMGSAPLSNFVSDEGYGNGAQGQQGAGFQANPAAVPKATPADDISPEANRVPLQQWRSENNMPTPAREGGPSTGPNNFSPYEQEVANDVANESNPVKTSDMMAPQGRTSIPTPPPVTPLSRPNTTIPGWHQTALTPGVQTAADAAGTASGQAEGDAVKRAGGVNQRVYQLTQALNGLQNSNTGPGTNEVNAVKSFLLANVPYAKDIDPDAVKSVASYDEAQKYLTQYAQNAAANFGPETDAKLAASLTGNANTHISNLAAQDVVKANIGLERMQAAQVYGWQQARKDPSNQLTDADFNDWMANSARTLDPRAFMLDKMTPQQRKGLFTQLEAKGNESDKANFAASLELANSSGLMPAPQGGQ